MKAAVFESYRGPLEVRTVPDPACPPDGVVLKIEACGVCRSDHHGWSGVDPDVALPHVPGHEFAGTVIAAGPACRNVRVGDRVTAPFILACGTCPDCRGGEPTICNHQFVVGFSGWGAFAEQLAVPHADFNVVKLPDSLGFAEAAAMGCRLTTAFRGLVDRAGLKPGEWLAIHGCGGVGLSAVMIGAAIGAQVLAVDINDEALAMARRLGASATLNPTAVGDAALAVRDLAVRHARHCRQPVFAAARHDRRRPSRSCPHDHAAHRPVRSGCGAPGDGWLCGRRRHGHRPHAGLMSGLGRPPVA